MLCGWWVFAISQGRGCRLGCLATRECDKWHLLPPDLVGSQIRHKKGVYKFPHESADSVLFSRIQIRLKCRQAKTGPREERGQQPPLSPWRQHGFPLAPIVLMMPCASPVSLTLFTRMLVDNVLGLQVPTPDLTAIRACLRIADGLSSTRLFDG
jgi:hypothetical protein